MRIVIDLQGALATSRARGIGRYSLTFAEAVLRNRGHHEVLLVLNGQFPDAVEEIRARLGGPLNQGGTRVWDASVLTPASLSAESPMVAVAESIREAFLSSLQPDVVLVTSLFEGYGDAAVTSVGRHVKLPTAVILYDLIPLIYCEHYLADRRFESWYLRKIDDLKRADLLLSISVASGKEAVEHLGFEPTSVVNIASAAHSFFRAVPVNESDRRHLGNLYGITRPFLLYTGGIDYRKNVEGLIRSFARLPISVRQNHQLAIVCAVLPEDRARLEALAATSGLRQDAVVLTGYVPDSELLLFYNACNAFVFPSWHEGFGLPVLEAMQCGKAVLASNRSSLPEVVGSEEALFDPHDEASIAARMEKVLVDDDYRARLEEHGLERAKGFSWDETARRAISSLERLHASQSSPALSTAVHRPLLAYVSPLPPGKSGIADYSAELLQELTRWFRVEVVVEQKTVSDSWVLANCPVRNVGWFRANHSRFQRVLYHFGNSDHHTHMFSLLREIPGVVVLHDFFLSGILAHSEFQGWDSFAWTRALYASHGYPAVQERYSTGHLEPLKIKYPANLPVLQSALGVIVHSEFSRNLMQEWYGTDRKHLFELVPMPRLPPQKVNRASARHRLGVTESDFVVCSFGLLDELKLNHRLLEAWLNSPLAHEPHARLVFVGEGQGEYLAELEMRIAGFSPRARVHVTGWTDGQTYREWLAAADVGVQLRTQSRGETSAAVLDCMNYGLATVVNANGSMAGLAADSVWKLPDDFTEDELRSALISLWREPDRRHVLGEQARRTVANRHAPRTCARMYAEAIEGFYARTQGALPGLHAPLSEAGLCSAEQAQVATCLARNFPPYPRKPMLMVDVSEIVRQDAGTGIQRVVRSILLQWLLEPPAAYRVEPVYANKGEPCYRFARQFTSRFLGVSEEWAEDAVVEAWEGDVFLGLDLNPHISARHLLLLQNWRTRGVLVKFVVYDLLPILLPSAFPDGAQTMFQQWLERVSTFDGAICISRATAEDLTKWLDAHGQRRMRTFAIDWFHLGGDLASSAPTLGMTETAERELAEIRTKRSFLMVGTIEPRKGHNQALAAFELLWSGGEDVNLVIVGKQGWLVEAFIDKLRAHPELSRRLIWLEDVSDEYLERVYTGSSCLLLASEGEGFGLPIIEAARIGLPIIARDIPVFKELAGEHATYFPDSSTPQDLANTIRAWLEMTRSGGTKPSSGIPWQSWKEAAGQLFSALVQANEPHRSWKADGVIRYWGNDVRLPTQVGERRGLEVKTTGREGFLVQSQDVSLAAGRYRLVASGRAECTSGEEWMDVAADIGDRNLAHVPLSPQDGRWLIDVNLVLERKTENLKVRLWVSEKSILSLERIELISSRQELDTAQGAGSWLPHSHVESTAATLSTEQPPSHLWDGSRAP